MFNIPILFIIFNRLETTKRVFAKIREIQPKQLFIAADGPRTNILGETEKCNLVRSWVLEHIDWQCEISTLFRNANIGCGKAPADAITWFFNVVEMGIILEDDCIPVNSFFLFCETLLNHYKNDMRIMQISGTNRLGQYCFRKSLQSYYFSNISSEWGWATWRRAWQLYDFNISFWKDDKAKEITENIFYKKHYFKLISNIYNETQSKEKLSWWDYQWEFIKNINSGLTITPAKNLISNIGFGNSASHTFDTTSIFNNIPSYNIIFPLKDPVYVYCDIELNNKLLDLNFPELSSLNKFLVLLRRTLLYKIVRYLYRRVIK